MRSLRLLVGCVLAILSVAGCSDSATSPVRPDGQARLSTSSGNISITFLRHPGDIGVSQTCTWEVLPSGGTGNYTYTWYPSGTLEYGGQYLNFFYGSASSLGMYDLTVQVTDDAGGYGSAYVSGNSTLHYNESCDM